MITAHHSTQHQLRLVMERPRNRLSAGAASGLPNLLQHEKPIAEKP
jgi:hypothetical protein